MENIEVKHLICGGLGSKLECTDELAWGVSLNVLLFEGALLYESCIVQLHFPLIGQVPQIIKFLQSSASFPLLKLQDWLWWWYPIQRALGSWPPNSAILEVTWNGALSWVQSTWLQECQSNSSRLSRANLTNSMKGSQKSRPSTQNGVTAKLQMCLRWCEQRKFWRFWAGGSTGWMFVMVGRKTNWSHCPIEKSIRGKQSALLLREQLDRQEPAACVTAGAASCPGGLCWFPPLLPHALD